MNTYQGGAAGQEIFFDERDLIVSKTDLKGKITYANEVFLAISGYSEEECLGAPHSLLRHPDMPRCIYQLLWETIQSGKEIFAYVKNRTKPGGFYWVYAHITPSFDVGGSIVGYHSNRRVPNRRTLDDVMVPLYRQLLKEEQRHSSRKDGLAASYQLLTNTLSATGKSYDEFIHSL